MQKGACNHVERTKILNLHNIREGERCGLSIRERSQLWHLTIETREIDSGFRWNRMTGDLCRDKHTWHRYGKMRVGTKMTQCLDACRIWCSGFAPVHMRLKHGKTSSKRIFRIMYQQFSTDAQRSWWRRLSALRWNPRFPSFPVRRNVTFLRESDLGVEEQTACSYRLVLLIRLTVLIVKRNPALDILRLLQAATKPSTPVCAREESLFSDLGLFQKWHRIHCTLLWRTAD